MLVRLNYAAETLRLVRKQPRWNQRGSQNGRLTCKFIEVLDCACTDTLGVACKQPTYPLFTFVFLQGIAVERETSYPTGGQQLLSSFWLLEAVNRHFVLALAE